MYHINFTFLDLFKSNKIRLGDLYGQQTSLNLKIKYLKKIAQSVVIKNRDVWQVASFCCIHKPV